MISLTQPLPMKDAVDSLSARTPLGTALRSAELESLPLEVKQRAFFSATVEEVKLLEAMKGQLMTRLKLERRRLANGEEGTYQRRDQFLTEMRALADKMGVRPQDERRGTLQDIGSFRRLRLIWDTQIDMARGYAAWKQGMKPAILNAAPAQELIRVSARRVPRDWARRWVEAGGEFYEGYRMIALKTDDIWERLSRFENPYPPFDFNSGMGVRNVRRREADRLGITKPGERIEAKGERDFSAGLSIKVNARGYVTKDNPYNKRLGDLVDVYPDRVEWRGDKLESLYDRAQRRLDGEKFEKKLKAVSLGVIDADLAARVRHLMEVEGYQFIINEDDVFHMLGRHGVGFEILSDQRGIDFDDFLHLMVNWRTPMRVEPGDIPNSFKMIFEHRGELTTVLWEQHKGQDTVILNTMWVKK